MAKTYSEQEVKYLMRLAWWCGHEESRYQPHRWGQCSRDVRELLKEHNEEGES